MVKTQLGFIVLCTLFTQGFSQSNVQVLVCGRGCTLLNLNANQCLPIGIVNNVQPYRAEWTNTVEIKKGEACLEFYDTPDCTTSWITIIPKNDKEVRDLKDKNRSAKLRVPCLSF